MGEGDENVPEWDNRFHNLINMTKTTELYTFKDELYGTIELYLKFLKFQQWKKKVKAIFFKNVSYKRQRTYTYS